MVTPSTVAFITGLILFTQISARLHFNDLLRDTAKIGRAMHFA